MVVRGVGPGVRAGAATEIVDGAEGALGGVAVMPDGASDAGVAVITIGGGVRRDAFGEPLDAPRRLDPERPDDGARRADERRLFAMSASLTTRSALG